MKTSNSLVHNAEHGQARLAILALGGQGVALALNHLGHDVQLQLGGAAGQQVLRRACR